MRLFIYLVACFSFFLPLKSNSQAPTASELTDTTVLYPLLKKMTDYFFKNTDSSLYYSLKAYEKASQSGNYPVMNIALQMAGEGYRGKGNFPRSLEMQLKALKLNRLNEDPRGEAYTFSFIGFTFLQLGDYRQALRYLRPAHAVLHSTKDSIHTSFNASNLGLCYSMLDRKDSADYFKNESILLLANKYEGDTRGKALRTLINSRIGDAFEKEGKLEQALHHYRLTLYYALQDSIIVNVSLGQKSIANILMQENKDDSAIFYAWNAILSSQLNGQIQFTMDAANTLASIFKKQGKLDSALLYGSMVQALRDSVFGVAKFSALQILMLNEQEEQQKLLTEKAEVRNKLRLSLVAVAAVAFFVVALILRRNNRAKQVINKQLAEQKSNLENTLKELKSTQSQLIQSEKMASLGELTAGIAHEIQNPLNFVNNFSEVNQDLIAEMKNEMAKGNLNDAEAIAESIRQNEVKINHHGKRADAIVKGMLQHSRTSSGQKEPTDINALADEYLRLSYHGMRAKDKTFNAELQTHFDPSAGKVIIVPQEMGRVLLNLYNNAFYAVNYKKKQLSNEYQPMVSLSTERSNGKVKITVTDNGNGVSEKIRDKIFQPFFTTKPTGEGTGLGLSLAYDIVKTHGGELKMETKESEGCEFVIQLPIV